MLKKKANLKRGRKESFTKEIPNGNQSFYEKFRNYQRILKNKIAIAKSVYRCNQITENKKVTWNIINELRG